MLHREPLLVTLVKLVDTIPMPQAGVKRKRGHLKEYTDRLIVKALVIMVIRRLYTAYSLLVFLNYHLQQARNIVDDWNASHTIVLV